MMMTMMMTVLGGVDIWYNYNDDDDDDDDGGGWCWQLI